MACYCVLQQFDYLSLKQEKGKEEKELCAGLCQMTISELSRCVCVCACVCMCVCCACACVVWEPHLFMPGGQPYHHKPSGPDGICSGSDLQHRKVWSSLRPVKRPPIGETRLTLQVSMPSFSCPCVNVPHFKDHSFWITVFYPRSCLLCKGRFWKCVFVCMQVC